jgi:hypothetical protein
VVSHIPLGCLWDYLADEHHIPRRLTAVEADERWSSWETYDRIEGLFGWPRSFH